MTALQTISALLGAAAVLLGVVRSVWNFPLAIGSVALFGWVVFHQRLYSDALLQAFFIGANVYGWVKWTKAGAASGLVPVRRMTGGAIAIWAAGGLAASLAVAWGFAAHTNALYPWWDAPTFVASVIAQILMGQRRLENWAIWVIVDLALIPLYAVQHLYGYAALYVVYLILSVWGWVDWRRAWAAHRSGLAGA